MMESPFQECQTAKSSRKEYKLRHDLDNTASDTDLTLAQAVGSSQGTERGPETESEGLQMTARKQEQEAEALDFWEQQYHANGVLAPLPLPFLADFLVMARDWKPIELRVALAGVTEIVRTSGASYDDWKLKSDVGYFNTGYCRAFARAFDTVSPWLSYVAEHVHWTRGIKDDEITFELECDLECFKDRRLEKARIEILALFRKRRGDALFTYMPRRFTPRLLNAIGARAQLPITVAVAMLVCCGFRDGDFKGAACPVPWLATITGSGRGAVQRARRQVVEAGVFEELPRHRSHVRRFRPATSEPKPFDAAITLGKRRRAKIRRRPLTERAEASMNPTEALTGSRGGTSQVAS